MKKMNKDRKQFYKDLNDLEKNLRKMDNKKLVLKPKVKEILVYFITIVVLFIGYVMFVQMCNYIAKDVRVETICESNSVKINYSEDGKNWWVSCIE